MSKNLQKIDIQIRDANIKLEEEGVKVSFELIMTLKVVKALLIEYPNNPQKLINHLSETIFYKMPEMQKYVLSDECDQNGLD